VIIDSFMFDDELDMLELRLRSMDWCAWHILVEAAETHRGQPKPYHYLENQRRFQAWQDKIIHVKLDRLNGTGTWDRLKWQQDQVLLGLGQVPAVPADYLLTADVDEILPPSMRDYLTAPVVAFRPRIMMYAVDWEYPGRYEGYPVIKAVQLRKIWGGRSVTAYRDDPGPFPTADLGFHFTWLGGTQAQLAKASHMAHTDMTSEMAARIASGQTMQGIHITGRAMVPVDVDEMYPAWIRRRECPDSWFRPREA
jgi:hypothetical protein